MFICQLTASHIRVLEFVLHPAYFVSVRAAGIRLWPKDLPFQQANLALELSAECSCITLDLKPYSVGKGICRKCLLCQVAFPDSAVRNG